MNAYEANQMVQVFLRDCAVECGSPANRELRQGLYPLLMDAARQGASLDAFREFVVEDYSSAGANP
jgi:hypothetical protein